MSLRSPSTIAVICVCSHLTCLSVSIESELLRTGTKSIYSSLDPGAELRVCPQQVLRKYLLKEGEKQGGRSPLSWNQIPGPWMWGPCSPTSHFPWSSSEPHVRWDSLTPRPGRGSSTAGIGGFVALSLYVWKMFLVFSLCASERIYFSTSENGKCSLSTMYQGTGKSDITQALPEVGVSGPAKNPHPC